MKLQDKEGLEIASVVKDVLEGKAVKKEKKKIDEVEEPRPEKEKEFKRKHVVKKSGENQDGTVTKEDKAEEAASPEEKAQQALKHAKEKEALKKKHDQEKERLNANEEVEEVEEKVSAEESKKEKYQKFFQAALKKFGVKSPAELEGDKKKEFFDYVDKNYEADNESD